MKEYLVNTKRKSCSLKFVITAGGEGIPITIAGYDPITPHTYYFKSLFLVSGREEIIMNCPQSPIFLKVTISSDGPFTTDSIVLSPMEKPDFGEPWIDFIEKFSRYEGIYRPGIFYADNVPFRIMLVREIYTDSGEVHNTPARIGVDNDDIEVSKSKFDAYSVPERIMILTHEVSHNFINIDPDSEGESDMNGKAIYERLGYPKIEAMYAFSSILSDTDENVQRMLNFINS